MRAKFKAIIFDLDDTLIATTEKCLPPALNETFAAMIRHGLEATSDECWKIVSPHLNSPKHELFLTYILESFSVLPHSNKDQILEVAINAFYKREVKEDLTLSHLHYALLSELSQDAELFIVSKGSKKTQLQKIRLAKLESFFKDVMIVGIEKKNKKYHCFYKVLETLKLQPHEILVVGNRLDDEISDGQLLGMTTCWMKKWSYHTQKEINHYQPTYIINDLLELREVCGL